MRRALAFRAILAGDERLLLQAPERVADGVERPTPESWTAFLQASDPDDRHLLTYACATAKAWIHAHENLGFELVRTQNILVREPGDGPREGPMDVKVIERFDEQARWVYDRCAGEWGISIIRDDAFLNRRFIDERSGAYRCLGVWDDAGFLRGYAVVALASDSPGFGAPPSIGDQRTTLVADWLVPHEEPEVGELLLEAVLAHARTEDCQAVHYVTPEWSPWFGRFQDRGFLVHPSDRIVAVNSKVPRYDMFWLRDHWWYQWADFHLV